MDAETTIFDILRVFVLWASPIVFIEGLLLLFLKVEKYIRLEEFLGKELSRGRLKVKLLGRLETNVYAFQNWLLKRTFALGVFFVVYSLLVFIVLMK